ncbi:MAG: hypothetical protein ABW101_08700 [Candidatus Thiodiazotropha sp.]
MKTILLRAATLVMMNFLLVTNSQAALTDLGGGLVYDSSLDVTWLQDGRYIQNTYFADGIQAVSWAEANATVAGMTYAGVSGWRLPHMGTSYDHPDNLDAYDSSLTNELGNLFYSSLGLSGYVDPNNVGQLPWDPDTVPTPTSDLVQEFFPSLNYLGIWTDTPVILDGQETNSAWYFHFHFGQTHYDGQGGPQTVWAVHDGLVSPVPVPPALLLMGSGILLMGFASKKRSAKNTLSA